MKSFYHPCKFCTLTINSLEVWPRQILLQITVFAVPLRNVLNTSQRLVNKNSLTWWYDLKMSWRYLSNKTSWRCLEDVLKSPWRRLKDVWPRRIYCSWPRRLEDVFRRRMTQASSSRQMFGGITTIFGLSRKYFNRITKKTC